MNDLETPVEEGIVVVTGAASGIGEATVEEFANCGATVFAVDTAYDSKLDEMDNKELNQKQTVSEVSLDVRDREQFRTLIKSIFDYHGSVDVLVNGAGVGKPRSFAETTDEQLTELLNVNVRGVWNGCQAAIPELLDCHGNIVNVASIAATNGASGYTGYAASKGAVLSLTRALADEFGAYGTRVNAVSPGTIETERIAEQRQKLLNSNRDPRIRSVTPLQRTGQPEEVARCIRFLASPDAAYVTGSELVVDGGRSATGP